MAFGSYALVLTCPDRPGIVAAVTTALYEHGANILEAHQYDDEETAAFFARFAFTFVSDDRLAKLTTHLEHLGSRFGMDWSLHDFGKRPRLLILASRQDHCLMDLLYRWRIGELAVDIAGIVSNHPQDTYAHHDLTGIRFNYLPVNADSKKDQEAEIWRIVTERNVDLVVLARYMQVLSSELAGKLEGRCINIHHSFLPSFKGARPYHQAHTRGVKLIGATAHYVTADLDEGPIIEQDVERVSHGDTASALARKGRDIERRVLAQAVTLHIQRRVIQNGCKTIVFKP